MPNTKPPEFEDRPALAEANPGDHFPPGFGYSRAFKIVSVLSGCFAGLVVLGVPIVYDDPFGSAQVQSVGAFCMLVYLYLQFASAWHLRCHPQTRRARIYFNLLALFPLWSLPAAWMITGIIIQLGFYIFR